MFQRLREAFREAVENFHRELGRDAPSGTTDRLLSGMRREVAGAREYLDRLEEEIRDAEAEADREAAEAETCRRRESMARRIQDEETARIAAEYAVRHERRERVLRGKAVALREELVIRREEADEMGRVLEDADSLRREAAGQGGDGIGSRTGRLDEDLRRVRERIDRADARREVDEILRDFDPPPRPEIDMDARLEELKRRMGER